MSVLRIGSTGSEVQRLQRALGVTADGWFGNATAAAVRKFQASAGLVVDGIAGPQTQAVLYQHQADDVRKFLAEADLRQAAKTLSVDLAAIKSVVEVESLGNGFLPDGRPVILFERHQFHKRLKSAGFDPGPLVARYPGICNPKRGGYAGKSAEWSRITLAQQVVPAQYQDVALESASWGLFQIMGFHWQLLGYGSARAFVDAMRISEGHQLTAFVRFVQADPTLHRALRNRSWTTFARLYNGPAYRDNLYDVKLARAYARHAAEAVPA